VNCASIPATLIESELFGYRKGAFSGAGEDRLGLVRSAQGGTLLLDEIGELPAAGQAVLLRVLQEQVVTPVGDVRPVETDVRFVAATNRDLPALVSAGTFRGDLYARLLGLSLRLPPLRERPEDLGQLVATLLPEVAARPETITLGKGAARALFAHRWPFNVRELERCLETAAALSDDGVIHVEHLRTLAAGSAAAAPEPEGTLDPGTALDAEDRARRDEIVRLLQEHRGNVAAVARALAKAPAQIHRWMKRYRLRPEDYRG
jgi:transcriptional regulator with GAF, ATPase, and Fis domain